MSEWKECKLEDVTETANTGLDAIKRAPIVDYITGFKCLRIQDVSQIKKYEDWGYCTVEEQNFKKFQLKESEILIARTGASIGVNKFIKKDEIAVFNNGLIRIRLKKEICDPKFIYFNFRSSDYNGFIESISGGTSTQPNMQIGALLSYPILLPPLPEQKAIASVLSSLDDKIDLLHRQNKTLEVMAETLFRQWFVEEADPGWEETSLYNCAQFINGSTFKDSDYDKNNEGLPIIKIVELKTGVSSQTQYTSKKMDDKYYIDNETILFSWSGTPEKSLGIFIWMGNKAVLNQHIFKIIPNVENEKYWIYYLLKHFMKDFIRLASHKQTVGLGHVTVNDLKNLITKRPDKTSINHFISNIKSYYDKRVHIMKQIRTLEKLRDTLLPKLMSGEVRVEI